MSDTQYAAHVITPQSTIGDPQVLVFTHETEHHLARLVYQFDLFTDDDLTDVGVALGLAGWATVGDPVEVDTGYLIVDVEDANRDEPTRRLTPAQPPGRVVVERVVRIDVDAAAYAADHGLAVDADPTVIAAELDDEYHPTRIAESLVAGDLGLDDLGRDVTVTARRTIPAGPGGDQAAARALHDVIAHREHLRPHWDRLNDHAHRDLAHAAGRVVDAYRGAQ